ncbi:hypothetical protein [uncultured Ilumatobacter sp.]|uniref:hypothetical protein n=1 Tax=uncultured Ilumatobacter sp. TaxID=879968 RepID=UPI00374F6503
MSDNLMAVGSATGTPGGAVLSTGRDNVDTGAIEGGIGTLDEELEEKFQKFQELFVSLAGRLSA